MQHHRLVAGTGRAGTSLLVRVLDACGFETEISRHHDSVFWDQKANAGIESIPVVGDDHPYVVKSPFSYQFIRELLARPDIKHDTHQPMEAIPMASWPHRRWAVCCVAAEGRQRLRGVREHPWIQILGVLRKTTLVFAGL
jgi:hypothetical protein